MPKIQSFLIDKKIPRLDEVIQEYLDNDRSLLVFCSFIDPLKRLHESYKKDSVIFHGSMNKEDRQQSINDLIEGKKKLGFFSLKAAGMGIDGLQNVIDTVIFLDYDWVPATHEQAEDRVHRIGQNNKVQVYYMIVENSIDEYMNELIKEKQQIASQIMDGKLINTVNTKSIFKEFVNKLIKEKLYS
jgi:SNF2 family DNA or RNA helicase